MGQTGKNVIVAIKEQSGGLGSPESAGAGALGLRSNAAQGLQLPAADIQSGEVRRDGQTTLGRLGSYAGNASYPSELRVGDPTLEAMIEAGVRGTWQAEIELDESTGSLGAITIASNVVTAAGGSWITQGLRVGMMVQFAGSSEPSNNGVWHRVIAVTASTFTVPDAPGLTDAASDAEWDITVARALVCSNPPDERYFTVEEYMQDSDVSKKGEDFKVGGFNLSVTPDNHVVIEFPMVGTEVIPLDSGSAPHFTSPTFSTSRPLVLLDGYLRVNGVDIVEVTDFQLSINPNPQTQAVLLQRKSPDVYMGNAVGSGSISGILEDLAEFVAFKAETNIELFLVAAENEDDPSDFISIYLGNAAYRGHQSPFGNDGAMIEAMPFAFGVDERGGAYFPSMLVISTSAPAA